MIFAWTAAAPGEVAKRLAALRLLPGLQVAQVGEQVWLSGAALSGDIRQRLRLIPGLTLYSVLPDKQLLADGALVPQGYLPTADWRPLREWSQIALPPPSAPASRVARVRLKVLRTTTEVDPNLLIVSQQSWAAYADTAPQVRLERWSFACNDRGQAIVRGTPLPPLPGERWVETDGVAVPAGFRWHPSVPAGTLRTVLGVNDGELVLLHPDRGFERLPADVFVRATRSAIRLSTDSGVGHG